MNGSFESPSHLERRIRDGLEDADDSSLSVPGWARRQNSQSLSFQTEDEGRTRTSDRILEELSEYQSNSKTPNSTASRTARAEAGNYTARSATATQLAGRSRPTLAAALARSSQSSSGKQGPQRGDLASSADLSLQPSEPDDSSFDDLSRSQAQPTRNANANPSASVSDADCTQENERGDPDSLPLTSTPHRSNGPRTQSGVLSFGQSRNAQSLAKRATELGARDSLRAGKAASQEGQRSLSLSHFTDDEGQSQSNHYDVSTDAAGESSSPEQHRAQRDDDPRQSSAGPNLSGTSQPETSVSRRVSPTSRRGSPSTSASARQAARAADHIARDSSDDVSQPGPSHSSPSAARLDRQSAPPMATPKPRIDRDRMQSYVLSTMKDPAREQRILRSVRAPRVRAQRIPIDQIEDDDTSEHQPGTPEQQRAQSSMSRITPFSAVGSRFGRPMTAMAGRTPLPLRPSRLANEINPDDTASQASEQSSTYDLMTPAAGWANTSEPGFGVAEGNAARVGNRIDPRKLSRQVHKMNENLEEENALLREEAEAAQAEMDALRRQLNTALREKENLAKQQALSRDAAQSPSQVPLPPSPAFQAGDGRFASRDPDRTAIPTSYEDALDRVDLLESHREELNGLLDNLEDKYEALQQENEELRQQGSTVPKVETSEQTESTTRQLQAELDQALGELDDLEYRLQESEDERGRMQAAVEQAKEFAMAESQKSEQARDEAVALAEQHRTASEKLQRQVEELQAAVERHKADRSQVSQSRAASGSVNQDDLNDIQDENERLRSQLGMARDEMDRSDAEHQRIRDELESALEANEAELQNTEADRAQLEEQLQTTLQQVEDLRDEVDRHKIALNEKDNELLKLTRQSSNDRVIQERIEALTRSLEVAERELANMQNKLADSVPLAQMQRELRLKDVEVETLARSKDAMEQRLQEYKEQMRQQQQSSPAPAGSAAPTPGDNTTLKTPAKGVHKSLLHLRTPVRTPQTPGMLSSASWLNETTIGNMDENVRNAIFSLQAQLDEANGQIDERLAQIDELGLGHLTLVKSLKEASDRIESLEAELEMIVGANGELSVVAKRLKAVRCDGCGDRFDATPQVKVSRRANELISSDYGAPDATQKRNLAKSARSHQRDRDLAVFAEKIPLLQTRLKAMEEENKRLREAGLGSSVHETRRVKEMARDLQKATHEEIQRARAVIDDMDAELREERRRLPELARDSKLFGDLTSSAEHELARTEVRLRAIDTELRRKVAEYEQYQQELMDKSTAGQASTQLQVLEGQIRHAAQELDHLRQDKNTVLQVRAELHSKFLSASERYNAVEADLRTTRETVTAHERQINSQTGKIEELHALLKSHRDQIQKLAGDRDRLTAQREMIIEDVSRLEVDLRRIRGESATFGRDLEKLRRDRDEQRRQAEAARESSVSITAEAQETIGLMRVQLNHAREMIREFEVTQQKAAAADHVSEATVAALREKHVAECQGLLLQIRYLKTKFMRESDLRSDLVLQKQYLLQVVGGLDMNEQETVRFLSDLERSRRGQSADEAGERAAAARHASDPRKRLRKVFFAVLAVSKARCMARRWSETVKVKTSLQEAHREARMRRQLRERGENESADKA